jgi:hypothetical protein
VDDLMTLASLPSKNIDNYMGKKDFVAAGKSVENNALALTFFEKTKGKKNDTLNIIRRVTLYKKDNNSYFAFHTSCKNEFAEGRKKLLKTGFSCNDSSGANKLVPLTFQKRNITVQSTTAIEEGDPVYTFLLEKKELPNPTSIRFADDLVRFTSHEYLVSFFGEKNVKKDVYYFSETQLRKCSVLFAHSSQQAVFVWEDEVNLSGLSYVVISGILPTVSAAQFTGSVPENRWVLKSGLYSGMSMRELIELNKGDFEFFGRDSDFSFMVDPQNAGVINFKKIGIMLGCLDCNGSSLLSQARISAADALEHNLKLHVFYIMIAP